MKSCNKCGSSDFYPSGKCKPCRIEYMSAYRVANKEKIATQDKVRRTIYQAAKPEKARARMSKWKFNNPEKSAEQKAIRRMNQKQAKPAFFSEFDDFAIKEAYRLSRLRFKATGSKFHVDHVVPIQSNLVCGLHLACNIQVLPAKDNISKNNRYWPDMP